MALTPLREIINRVRQLAPISSQEVFEVPADIVLRQLRENDRVVLVNRPKGFDSGISSSGIPIYDLDEMAEYPFRGEGESIERLAWYISYHYGELGWGIYITRSGIYKVANALIAGGYPESEAIEQARALLLRHEQTHFQTDLGITSLEIASNRPIFIEARRTMNAKSPGWHSAEEGFANALARRQMKKPKDAFDTFLDSSPVGYRDWKKYKPAGDSQTWNMVLTKLLHNTKNGFVPSEIASEVSNLVAPKYFADIAVYEVYDIAGGDLRSAYFTGPIKEIVESPSFLEDLEKLAKGQPSYRKKWQGVKAKLAGGNLVGVHFEVINKAKKLHSVRIDGEARAGLQRDLNWTAVAAGHHDELYRRLGK
jgi:hypothetical protein